MSHGRRHLRNIPQTVLPVGLSGFLPGNQVTLLQNGESYFPALEAAFDRARNEIYLETYIYENDTTGRRIADALKRAARRGVKAHVLIDGYGSKDLPKKMLDDLRAGGVEVLIYRPKISPWSFRRKRLRRMHRKIVVVDREIAFVGGINIIDDRETTGDLPPRYDYAVAVEGPLVDVIRLPVLRLWSIVAWSYFCKGTSRDTVEPTSTSGRGQMRAAFVVRDNFHHRRDIEAVICGQSNTRNQRSYSLTLTFCPGRLFVMFLSMLPNAVYGWSCCCRGELNIFFSIMPRGRFTAILLMRELKFMNTARASCTPRLR